MRLFIIIALLFVSSTSGAPPERIAVSPDQKGFRLEPSGKPFVIWGLNYDRDYKMRLIEDYWDAEWATIVRDFTEMHRLGANVVRIHLQFGKFMDAPGKPNAANLSRLEKLADLCESLGLYLDITGLGSYRAADVPAWYDALSEHDRWQQQAAFWEAIAGGCATKAAVVAYDLVNEPVVPDKPRPAGRWLFEGELGGFHYNQFLVLDPAGRKREEIWKSWAAHMSAAIHRHDATRPITLGLLPLMATADLQALATQLDYVSVHIYPQSNNLPAARKTLEHFAVGKPVVIEETFPLACTAPELKEFINNSKDVASGWVGFYWGKDMAQLKQSKEIGDQLELGWLELFQGLQ